MSTLPTAARLGEAPHSLRAPPDPHRSLSAAGRPGSARSHLLPPIPATNSGTINQSSRILRSALPTAGHKKMERTPQPPSTTAPLSGGAALPTRATGFLHRKTRPLKVRAGRKGVFRLQAEFLGKICPVRIRQYAVVTKRRGLRPGDRALLQRLAQAATDVVLVFARREKSRSYSAHSRDHVCKFCTFWHFSVVRAKKAPGRALRPGEVAIISCPC